MKIFVNRKIKLLFAQILLSIGAVALLMLTLFILFSQYGVIEILVCSALLCGLIFAFLYQYFKAPQSGLTLISPAIMRFVLHRMKMGNCTACFMK